MSAEEFNRRMRERRLSTCKHFTGLQHGTCKVGIKYEHELVRKTHPEKASTFSCVRDERWREYGVECPSYVATTEAEVDAEDALYEETFRKVREGISPCCDAKVQPMGHGLGCSKCRKLLVTQCEKVKS